MSDLERRLEEVFATDARARRVERVHLTPRSSGGPLAGVAFVAAVSLAVVAAIILLGTLRPQDRGPVAASASPSAAASTSPSPSQAPSATASGSMATPRDLVLPAGCSLVGPPTTTDPGPVTTWEVNCGAKPDATAVERFTPVLAQQGWVLCKSGQGRGFWWKGATQTIVSQSAAGYPTLSQLPRQPDDCPAAAARPEKLLGYISHGSGGALPILRTEADATPIRALPSEIRVAATRDGRRVAYLRTGETVQQLLVFDTARPTQRAVLDLSGSGEEAGGLVWATDADEVLLAIHKIAGTGGAKEYSRLVAVDMASGRTREIYRSTSGLALEPLAWRAATATAAAIETGPGGYAVTYVHLRGATATRHAMEAQVIASSVRASPDGERVVQVDGLGRAPTRGVTWWPAARYDERQRFVLAEHDVSVALWRPGADELVVFVTPSMKTTSPGPRIERWSLAGAKRMVREIGAPPAVVRVDGSAVITTGGMLVDLETGDATPIPGARNDLWPRVAVAF